MKTLKNITDKIQAIRDTNYLEFMQIERAKQKKVDRKELEFLEEMKKYLLTDPPEEYLQKEERRLESLIENVMDRFVFSEKLNLKQVGELRKAHEKQYDIPKHRKHLKTIRYILY